MHSLLFIQRKTVAGGGLNISISDLSGEFHDHVLVKVSEWQW